MKLSFTSFGALHVARALAVIFIIGPAVLLTACAGETAEQEGKAENAAADGKTAKKVVAPKPAPLRVRVVVPYGGNMPGFMNFLAPVGAAPTEFQHRVGDLLTAIGKGPTKLTAREFFTTDNAGHLTSSTYAALSTLVDGTTPNLQYTSGLEIPPLLADAVAAAEKDPSVVTVLVTDLVQNAGNPTMLAALQQTLEATLIGPSGPAAFSVYAEPSRFVGTYYPAIGHKLPKVNGTSIPYYIWLIGTPKQISRVARAYLPNPPARQAHVGLTYKGLAAGALLTSLPAPLQTGGGGSVYWGPVKGQVAVLNASDSAEFSVGLDLRQLPSAWKNFAFLNTSLRVRLPGGTVTLLPKSVRWLTPAEHAASPALKPYTHTARVRITKLAPDTSTLTFSLPAPELPDWPGAWTTAADQQPGLATYKLKQMLEGARQAHGARALPAVFSVSISLVNDDPTN